MESLFVDRDRRFSLDIDRETGRTFVSIPVRNRLVAYEEQYEIDRSVFEAFVDDPTQAHDFVDRARRRELDHLLLRPPGSDRGVPD